VGLALTEHGLYTHERAIDIFQSSGLFNPSEPGAAPQERFFKTWWRDMFAFLGRLTYESCDVIVTLHEPNRRMQVAAGAPDDRLVVVPNGIDPARYVSQRAPRDWSDRPFRVGLIGRVVPIKDIKTFLRSVQIAAAEVPLEAYVLGPTDEDPAYHAECLALTRALGLEDTVRFLGKVDVLAWLPKLDLNVLTSVSESQPLVLLEGWAAGVPAVATDVGACREMVEGRAGEDAMLGASGIVTPVATPESTAAAMVKLARDPERHAGMARAGYERVSRYYRQEQVFEAYRGLYRDLAASPGRAR
jgi:glycosyltransferase involved in cell wall biosynthesis